MGVLTVRPFAQITREGKPPILMGVQPGDDHTETLDGDTADDRTFSVGAETTVTLWDATVSPVSAMSFLWIEAEASVVIELITDQNAGVGKEVFTITIEPGKPFMLGSNVSYANYTTNFAGGTLDVIDKILCRNLDADDAAEVRVVVAK